MLNTLVRILQNITSEIQLELISHITKFTHQHLIHISYLTPAAQHATDSYPESCNWACPLGYQSLSKPRISMKGRILQFNSLLNNIYV